MRFALLCSWLLAGCTLYSGDDPSTGGDVVGPFTGPHHRYLVDAIYLPKNNTDARQMGVDLDGDKAVDNTLGQAVGTLTSFGDVTSSGPDMIAGGAIRSSIEIVADDLQDDDTVSVVYHGSPGDAGIEVGGTLSDGWFRSNPSVSSAHPGLAITRLPVFVDADPATVQITHLEIELQPDQADGYDAYLRGTVDPVAATGEALRGSLQMIAASPRDHLSFMQIVDTQPKDWMVTETEFRTNSVISSLFSADVTRDGKNLQSFGFRVHVVPCDGGCDLPAPIDRCHDRVIDQDETGVDCGGATCGACPGAESCSLARDCQSQQCDGTCAAPTCSDGVQDGFEPDLDCGAGCGPCAIGKKCDRGSDCAIGSTCVIGRCTAT